MGPVLSATRMILGVFGTVATRSIMFFFVGHQCYNILFIACYDHVLFYFIRGTLFWKRPFAEPEDALRGEKNKVTRPIAPRVVSEARGREGTSGGGGINLPFLDRK